MSIALIYEYALDEYQEIFFPQNFNIQGSPSGSPGSVLFIKSVFMEHYNTILNHYVYREFYPFHVLLLFFIFLTRTKVDNNNGVFDQFDTQLVQNVYRIHPWSRPFLKDSFFLTDEPRDDLYNIFSEAFYLLLCKKMHKGLQKIRNKVVEITPQNIPQGSTDEFVFVSLFEAIEDFRTILLEYIQYRTNPELLEQIVEIGYDPDRVEMTQRFDPYHWAPWQPEVDENGEIKPKFAVMGSVARHDPNSRFRHNR
jgi:hypothetical protein